MKHTVSNLWYYCNGAWHLQPWERTYAHTTVVVMNDTVRWRALSTPTDHPTMCLITTWNSADSLNEAQHAAELALGVDA